MFLTGKKFLTKRHINLYKLPQRDKVSSPSGWVGMDGRRGEQTLRSVKNENTVNSGYPKVKVYHNHPVYQSKKITLRYQQFWITGVEMLRKTENESELRVNPFSRVKPVLRGPKGRTKSGCLRQVTP